MGFALPPAAASLASRLLGKSGVALSDADKATQLAARLETLSARPALTAAEQAEKKELTGAVDELKKSGWSPKKEGTVADRNESSFDGKKKKNEPKPATGVIDGIQSWVDGATLAAGVTGAGLTLGTVTAPAGVVVTAVGDIAGVVNAGVDVLQAGAAAVQGDFPEAGKQLLEGGERLIGSIPYVGTAVRAAKLAKAAKAAVELTKAAEKTAVVATEVGTTAATKAGGAAAAKATTGLSDDAVRTFVKETADHPALTDLEYSLGKKFAGATLDTLADPAGVKAIATAADAIRSGKTAGTTLSRYAKGEEGVNDFLQDVAARFAKSHGAEKVGADAVGELSEGTAKLLGKTGAPLTESVEKALAKRTLRTQDLPALRRASQLIADTNNPIVREGISNAVKKALESGAPGKALTDLADKATLIDKVSFKGTSLTTKLSQSSRDASDFRQAFESLLDSRISVDGLKAALKPELLEKVTDQAGFKRLANEAIRASL